MSFKPIKHNNSPNESYIYTGPAARIYTDYSTAIIPNGS